MSTQRTATQPSRRTSPPDRPSPPAAPGARARHATGVRGGTHVGGAVVLLLVEQVRLPPDPNRPRTSCTTTAQPCRASRTGSATMAPTSFGSVRS
jgi:hypothetical protein